MLMALGVAELLDEQLSQLLAHRCLLFLCSRYLVRLIEKGNLHVIWTIKAPAVVVKSILHELTF
jgi:hypothetical protein